VQLRLPYLAWAILQFCIVPSAGAAVYQCTTPDGSVAYSDVPCATKAQSIPLQSASPGNATSTSLPEIQRAAYVSPRNGRSLDVTVQIRSQCQPGTPSCNLKCGNQLAGDPDFGQRKYCSVSYRCGGNVQETQMQEGESRALTCSALPSATAVRPDTAVMECTGRDYNLWIAAQPRPLPDPKIREAKLQEIIQSCRQRFQFADTDSGAQTSTRNSAAVAASTPGAPHGPLGHEDIVPSVAVSPATEKLAAEVVHVLSPVDFPARSSSVSAADAEGFAVTLVQELDPNNPAWNAHHPQWTPLLNLVSSDIAPDLTRQAPQLRTQLETVMAHAFAQRLTSEELTQLLHYFKSPKGQRYLAFEAEMGPLQTRVLGSILAKNATPPPGTRPADDVLKRRLHLLSLGTNAQVTRSWHEEAERTHGDTSGFQAFGFIAGAVALREGATLDDIANRYKTDLKDIEDFTNSPLSRRFYTAFGAASLALGPSVQSALDSFKKAERDKYGGKWRARYATTVTANAENGPGAVADGLAPEKK
jgi:hypothetical protein